MGALLDVEASPYQNSTSGNPGDSDINSGREFGRLAERRVSLFGGF